MWHFETFTCTILGKGYTWSSGGVQRWTGPLCQMFCSKTSTWMLQSNLLSGSAGSFLCTHNFKQKTEDTLAKLILLKFIKPELLLKQSNWSKSQCAQKYCPGGGRTCSTVYQCRLLPAQSLQPLLAPIGEPRARGHLPSTTQEPLPKHTLEECHHREPRWDIPLWIFFLWWMSLVWV